MRKKMIAGLALVLVLGSAVPQRQPPPKQSRPCTSSVTSGCITLLGPSRPVQVAPRR